MAAQLHCFSHTAHGKLRSHRQPQTASWRNACATANSPGCSSRQQFNGPCHPPTNVSVRALPSLEVDTVTVVSVLKGPTLSELLVYGQTALSFAGTAWQAAIAPFAIFGTDRWGLNLLFYFAVLLMGFNLIIQAPKQ